MDTFDDLMERVDELFGMNDIQSQKYLRQIEEDPYSRWFAYDVTRNHLRYYRRYRRSNVVLMDNGRGPRWALYGAVMEMIDGLVDERRIVEVNSNEYKVDPIWIHSESVGLVGRFDIDDCDDKLEYLDIQPDTYKRMNVYKSNIRLTDRMYPRLTHTHILLDQRESINRITLSGRTVRYLSVTNCPSMEESSNVDVILYVDGIQLDYIQLYHVVYGKIHLPSLKAPENSLGSLLNRETKYCDIVSMYMILKTILWTLRWKSPYSENREIRLNHFGFRTTRNDKDPDNTTSGVKDDIMMFPELTSLSLPVLNKNIPIINKLSDQLVNLGLDYVSIVNIHSMPTRLKYIRTLHISFLTSSIDFKMGRWNLPSTCSVLSISSHWTISKLDGNFDLSKFKRLKYLMTKWHEYVVETCVDPSPPDTTVSIVDRPFNISEISTDREIVWKSNEEFTDMPMDKLIDLSKDVVSVGNYNSIVFIKREILRRYRLTLDSPSIST